MSPGATPFCGPKIAVAPCAPLSGLLTSDMMRISQSARRGSSDAASTVRTAASASGVGATAPPSASCRVIPSAHSSPLPPSLVLVPPSPTMKRRTPLSSSVRTSSPTPRSSARPPVPPSPRVGDADHLRDLEHRGRRRRSARAGRRRRSRARRPAPATSAVHRRPAGRPRPARRRACPRRRRPSAAGAGSRVGQDPRESAGQCGAHLRPPRSEPLKESGAMDDAAGGRGRASSHGRRPRRGWRARGGRAPRPSPGRAGTSSIEDRTGAARIERAQVGVEVVRIACGVARRPRSRPRAGAGAATVRASTATTVRPPARRDPRAGTSRDGRARRVMRGERAGCARRVGVPAARSGAPKTRRERAHRRCRPDAAASARRRRTRRSCSRCRPSHAPPSTISETRVAQVVGDVLRRGRRDAPEAIGRRRGDAAAAGAAKAASSACATGCDGTRRPTLSWPPVTTSAHVRRRAAGSGSAARARTRRPARRAPRGTSRAQRAVRCASLHVHDHRMVGGPALGGEDRAHGRRVARVARRARRRSRWERPRARPRAGARGVRERRRRGGHDARALTGCSPGHAGRCAELLEFELLRRVGGRTDGTLAHHEPQSRPCALCLQAGSIDEQFSVHVGIGVGRSSGQGRGPDLRRRARRDSRARPDGPGRRRDAGLDRPRA